MQVVTVTANAALDVTYLLDGLAPGAVNTVERVVAVPGGKGNNVARVLARLGCSPIATGFAGGWTGRRIEEGLREAGVEPAFVPITSESRTCLTLVDRAGGTVTEVREPGAPVAADAAAQLAARVVGLAAPATAVAFCGSLPPGMPPDTYATLIGALRPRPPLVALDAAGETLRRGLAGGPDLVAPNRAEMAELMGREAGLPEMVAFARSELIGGALPEPARVLLKLGADGAVLIDRRGALRAIPPTVTAVNPVGCGDALLAGFLSATGGDPAAALAAAVAVGTAAALGEGVGEVDLAAVQRVRQAVRVEAVAGAAPVGGSGKG